MARGHYTRKRVRPGYLACGDPLGIHRARGESTQRPEEEFRLLRRVYAGREKFYRTSYCRACESAYNVRKDKALAAADPAYHDRRKRRGRKSYRENAGAARRCDRAWRIGQAREAVVRLNAAGWSCERIATETGINSKSLRTWLAGGGRPRDEHVLTLRGLVARLAAALTGPLKGIDQEGAE